MMQTIELRIPSDPKMLKIVRSTVAHLCQILNFSSVDRNSVVLAVDEACSNVIKHAYQGQIDQLIQIIFNLTPEMIEIQLHDHGKPVAREAIKSRDLKDIRPGGLGVHLIQNVMDEVKYDSRPADGNWLRLVKYCDRTRHHSDQDS